MEDKSLTSMAITVMVALIVTGVVLIPVVNGLNGEGGGDGSGGGILSNPIPAITMAYAEEGADGFTITIDAVRYMEEESQYPGIYDTGYLQSLTITTPNGSISIDVGDRLSAYSDFWVAYGEGDPNDTFQDNEDYLDVQSALFVPIISTKETILYYNILTGWGVSFGSPFDDISDIDFSGELTQVTYTEIGDGVYGAECVVDGSTRMFVISDGFYHIQKNGDYGVYTRLDYRGGLNINTHYPLNPFYWSDNTINIGVYTIYNENFATAVYDTGINITVNSTVSNNRLTNIEWTVRCTPHYGSQEPYTNNVHPMLLIAPITFDPNDRPAEKVYHNIGSGYSKVTSDTDVTIYPYYNYDEGIYYISYTDPLENPDADMFEVTVNSSILHPSIIGESWVLQMCDYYNMDSSAPYYDTYKTCWEYWELVDAENDEWNQYYGMVSISDGIATFNGYDTEDWSGVTFTLPSAPLYYPDADGEYVYPSQNSTIYMDENSQFVLFLEGGDCLVIGTMGDYTIDNPYDMFYDIDNLSFDISDMKLTAINYTIVNGDGEDNYDETITEFEWTVCIMSRTVGGQSIDDGGSDGNGSNLGVAGTIIGIIPIFVVISILMYAVTYFRDYRKAV